MLEAEKGKCFAEAATKALEEKVREIGIRLSAAEDKLMEAESHMQLLRKEAKSYKEQVKETQDKMEEENMHLSSDLAELCEYLCMCVCYCVRACVCACVRACVRACVCVHVSVHC